MTGDQAAGGPVEPPASEPSGAEVGHRGPATPTLWSLVAVNVVVFALELAWGGSDSPLTLHRMGAGLGRVGLAHEPWRIISAAFLHLSVLHLALNMWALVVFGRMLEIMLGARRFIVLYALSAAGGGLASSVFHAQILSAGASGAVWGLMTAQIALIARLKWQHGAERVPVGMSTLLKPLVVNLLFSLLPFIDLAAHLGGGVVGAGLILSGLMWGPRPAAAWRPAAWAASLAMAACLAVALGHGRPWELRWPPSLVPQAIPDTPVIVGVPRGLQPQPSSDEDAKVFGNLGSDPLAAYCAVGKLDAAVAEQGRREYLSQMARDAAAQPLDKGQVRDQSPHVVQLRLRPAVFFASRFPQGGRIQTWLMVEGSWWVRLDVVLRPDAPASWAKLPAAIADGITILPSELPIQWHVQEDTAATSANCSVGVGSLHTDLTRPSGAEGPDRKPSLGTSEGLRASARDYAGQLLVQRVVAASVAETRAARGEVGRGGHVLDAGKSDSRRLPTSFTDMATSGNWM